MFFFRKHSNFIAGFIFRPISITLLGLIILIFLSIPLYEKFKQKNIVNAEIEELKNEIARTGEENLELSKMIDYLESEQFKEGQARLNFGLKKRGENVAVIRPSLLNDSLDATSTKSKINSPSQLNISNSERWMEYFFSSK